MTKAQYLEIVKHVTEKHGSNFRLRLNLTDGNWIQGNCDLLGTRTVVAIQDNKQLAYVDLEQIVSISAG